MNKGNKILKSKSWNFRIWGWNLEEIETVLCFCTKQREEKRENERRSERRGEGATGRDEEKKRAEKFGEKEREVLAKEASKRTVFVFFFQCNDKLSLYCLCYLQ